MTRAERNAEIIRRNEAGETNARIAAAMDLKIHLINDVLSAAGRRSVRETWATPERLEIVERMWREGKSAAEIAATLDCGISRNAVIGVVHRNEWTMPERAKVTQALQNVMRTKARAKPKAPKPVAVQPIPIAPVAEPEPKPSPILAVVHRSCQWPYGDPRDISFRFCGCEAEPERPYCAKHVRIAYRLREESAKAPWRARGQPPIGRLG